MARAEARAGWPGGYALRFLHAVTRDDMSSSRVGGEGDVSTFGVSATVCSVSSLADGAAFPRNLSARAGSLMLAASDGEGRAPGMKVSAFHLMPHRELPSDFERRYPSVWVTPPWGELADARRVGQYYNWTLDELLHAARAGFDGVCTNEHHQNAYGFMPSPNRSEE